MVIHSPLYELNVENLNFIIQIIVIYVNPNGLHVQYMGHHTVTVITLVLLLVQSVSCC